MGRCKMFCLLELDGFSVQANGGSKITELHLVGDKWTEM